MMNKEREQMLDNVIRQYGFEARQTIKFANACEKSSDEVVNKMYAKLMA